MRVDWKGGLSAIGVSILWGGNIVAIKIALQAILPIMMAALTFALGALSILSWAILNGISIRPRPGETASHLINGTLFAIQVVLFYIGADWTSASHAVILTNTNIFFVAMLAHFFIPGDRLTLARFGGLMLSFGGVAYLFMDRPSFGAEATLPGNLIVLLSAFLLGARIVYIKKLVEFIDPWRLVLWQMFVGVPLLFLLAVLTEGAQFGPITAIIVSAVLFQGVVVAGFTFVASTLLLKYYPPTALSAYFFAVPIAGVGLSHLILGEVVTQAILVSVLVVAIGIYVVNVRERVIVD